MYRVDTKQRAKELFPENQTLQQRWAAAVSFLRRGAVSKWVLDGQHNPNWIATAK
jgi:hypothetical protein